MTDPATPAAGAEDAARRRGRRHGAAGADLGLRQDRGRRLRRGPGAARGRDHLHRRHRHRRCARPGSRCADVAELTGSAGDPRRPGEDASPAPARGAAGACATTPSTWRRWRREGIEPIDLVCVNLYPFERTVARPGRERGRGDREHRHRRPDDDPRRGQEPPRASPWSSSPRATTRCSPSSRSPAASISAATRHWLANEAFAHDRPLRRGDQPLVRRPRYEDFPEHWVIALREGARPLLRREPAPAGGALRRRSGPARHVLSRVAKLHGRALSFNNVLDLDAARRLLDDFEPAGLRDRQAQQPLRGGDRRGRSARPTRRRSPATRCPPSAA